MSKVNKRKKDKSKKSFEHINMMKCVMKRFNYIVNKVSEIVEILDLSYKALNANSINKTKKLTQKSLFVLKDYIIKSLADKIKLIELIKSNERIVN